MKYFASRCADCQYRGRHIYFVGSLRFERELIINYIKNHTAARWYEVNKLEDVPVSNQGVPFGQKMIMVDTRTMDRENLMQLLQSQAWQVHSQDMLVLFNVVHGLEIEKAALRNGARGLLYEDDPTEDLLNGICTINSGELWVSRGLLSECLLESYAGNGQSEPVKHSMSAREIEILHFLSTGASNKAIAEQLCISTHTVKTHLQNIFRKIDVASRVQAVLWAKNNLLVRFPFLILFPYESILP
ncbi:response regulator transcription factor [Geopsychrobacter electrodiphilus]|uniref:response regulator transcription factor n=1 Tax=Geopsychrobacter electrodiphilus TaxID=225196 RepID=UPI0003728FF8|nr:response regulator transcription factor [Geopsychrobacter electrodiphilus]